MEHLSYLEHVQRHETEKIAIKHFPTLPRSKPQTHRQSREEWLPAEKTSARVSEFPCLQVGVVAIFSPYVCVVLCVGTCLCVHAATSLVKYFLTNTVVQVCLQTPETTIIY